MRRILLALLVVGCGSHSSGDVTPDSCTDADGDGQTDCAGDCNDADATVFTGNTEVCGDAKDNNCDGTVDDICMGLGTWVSNTTGDDANPGTQASPVKTIAKGLANAATIGGGQDVYLGDGHYTEKVTMVEGTDLLGGYSCSASPCSWAHDPAMYDSAVLDVDAEGISVPAGITNATKIDGIRVAGFAASTGASSAITVSGAPTISNNKIAGGAVTGSASSIAIALLAPTSGTVKITSNDITVGSATNAATGISFTAIAFPVAGPSVAEIRKNKIAGGTALNVAGIGGFTSGAATLIADNDIVSGTSAASAAARGGAWGIRIGGAATIDTNRINLLSTTPGTCNPADFCGGIESESGTLTITNNVIYGPPTARSAALRLREVEQAAGVVIVNGNYLDGGGGIAGSGGPTVSAAIQLEYVACGNCGVNAVMGRIRNNILMGGSNANRVGILEADNPNNRTNRPEAVENNLFWFMASSTSTNDVLWRQWTGTTGVQLTTIAQVNAATMPVATANQNADPTVSMWHLVAGSPCADTGTATEAPAKDMDGEARPKGSAPDIGPDEL